MRIIRDEKKGTWTFVAGSASEAQAIASIGASLKPDDKIAYTGREVAPGVDQFSTLHFKVGGNKFVLRGSTRPDKLEVNRIRDTCFFGSSEPLFVGHSKVGGRKAIIITGGRCKHCEARMIKYSRCEWGTCDACVAKCDHKYESGFVHGNGVGLGEFCKKCGLGKPEVKGEKKKTEAEHILGIKKQLGVSVVIHRLPGAKASSRIIGLTSFPCPKPRPVKAKK